MRRPGPILFAVISALSPACGDDSTSSGESGDSSSSSTGDDSGDASSTADASTSGTDGSTSADTTGTSEASTGETDSGDVADDDTSSESGDESTSTGEATMCAPEDIGNALGEVATGTTTAAGNDIQVKCTQYDGEEREFTWTAPADGSYRIDTLGSSYDTALAVWTDGCEGETIACNDDFEDLESAVLVELTAGQTIMVIVDGYGAQTGDFVLNISEAAPGDCCLSNLFPGCDDPTCEAAVCAIDETCCTDEWSSECANEIAPSVCEQCAPPGSCCFAHEDPSCDDQPCAAEVCDALPACCETGWTADCAALALEECTECQPGVGDCCVGHLESGCEDLSCEDIVCADYPWCCQGQWDSYCADIAQASCPVCQEPGPCCFPNEAFGCEDADIETCVCQTRPECCSGSWTPDCVAEVEAGSCGTCDPGDLSCVTTDLGNATGEVATGTNGGTGDDLSVPCAPPGGQEIAFTWTAPSTGEWSFDTFGSTYDVAIAVKFPDCDAQPLACAGGFQEPGQTVTLEIYEGVTVVVVLDAFGAAIGNYVLNINPPAQEGFCCLAKETSGCEIASCQAAVCDVDPTCCTGPWDEACATLAQESCAICEPGAAGSCCETQAPFAGCGNLTCAQTVCAQVDASCCYDQWHSWCADQAEMLCGC